MRLAFDDTDMSGNLSSVAIAVAVKVKFSSNEPIWNKRESWVKCQVLKDLKHYLEDYVSIAPSEWVTH